MLRQGEKEDFITRLHHKIETRTYTENIWLAMFLALSENKRGFGGLANSIRPGCWDPFLLARKATKPFAAFCHCYNHHFQGNRNPHALHTTLSMRLLLPCRCQSQENKSQEKMACVNVTHERYYYFVANNFYPQPMTRGEESSKIYYTTTLAWSFILCGSLEEKRARKSVQFLSSLLRTRTRRKERERRRRNCLSPSHCKTREKASAGTQKKHTSSSSLEGIRKSGKNGERVFYSDVEQAQIALFFFALLKKEKKNRVNISVGQCKPCVWCFTFYATLFGIRTSGAERRKTLRLTCEQKKWSEERCKNLAVVVAALWQKVAYLVNSFIHIHGDDASCCHLPEIEAGVFITSAKTKTRKMP